MIPVIRVLIVDDEEKMTKLLKMIVEENFDCTVETFNDPRLAKERMDRQEFDVISLDYRMPGLTGIDLLKHLRQTPASANHKTPVLFFTGYREEAEPLASDFLENLMFVEKPIEDERYVYYVKIGLAMKMKSNGG